MKIPVVFATNNDYALFCYTAIFSLLKTKNTTDEYDIRILQTNLRQDHIHLLESLSCSHVSVTCVDVSKYVDDIDIRGYGYISAETFYRFFIPKIMYGYEKVLYLDSDIIVRRDVAELFKIEMNGYPLAAVRDADCPGVREHCRQIGLPDEIVPINCGVVMFNIEEYEKNNVRERCLALLKEDYANPPTQYTWVDQDVTQIVLQGNILLLEAKWNFQWQYSFRAYILGKDYKKIYLEAEKEPWIVHYASGHKPWLEPELKNATYFWECAMETPCFRNIIKKALELARRIDKRSNTYRFPFEYVPSGSRVAIYAAGVVGESFYDQLLLTHYAKLVFWVDKNADSINEKYRQEHKEHCRIFSLEKLIDEYNKYDYVVVAVKDMQVGDAIVSDLQKSGIPTEKIIFCDYISAYRHYSCRV